jgi:hypothetical protein
MGSNQTACLVFSVLAALGLGCSPAEEPAAESDESNQTSSSWSSTSIGDRPNRDIGTNERVAIAVGARGQRHAVYVGKDLKTHYVDLSANRDEVLGASPYSTDHAIALDPAGEPHIGFYSSLGATHAFRRNGAWVLEPIGTPGYFDAIAVDATGTVHIASHDIPAGSEWTATHSTKASSATAFSHTPIPGKLPREIGFGAFAFAVGADGTAFAMLSSFESIEEAPNRFKSGPTHTYFAKRPAGGTFTVEVLGPSASSGSLLVDSSGVLHAVLAVKSPSSKPMYFRRGPTDTAFSAPEEIFWDGFRTSLALDANGTLHVAITGNVSSFLAYGKRPASGPWSTEIITASDAALPSIAIDATGKPIVAYRTGAGYHLASRRD